MPSDKLRTYEERIGEGQGQRSRDTAQEALSGLFDGEHHVSSSYLTQERLVQRTDPGGWGGWGGGKVGFGRYMKHLLPA